MHIFQLACHDNPYNVTIALSTQKSPPVKTMLDFYRFHTNFELMYHLLFFGEVVYF